METISAGILNNFKDIDESYLDKLLNDEIEKNNKKIVVLDDDPTGVQTVHDVSVYTDWSKESIKSGFEEKNKLFYILTNSRGFTIEQTIKAHKEIANTIAEVGRELNKEYIIISRSDSTLRGHYPLETKLLKDIENQNGKKIDGEILCPFFKEGGRFTINNIHYVKYDNKLVPAGETEFAKDKTFGYTSSNMCEYIEEKTNGEFKKENVTCISLDDIRSLNFDKIEKQLSEVNDFNKVVVNAIDYCDIKVFCIALYRAMAKGKTYMFRTAAAIVKVIGGITNQPLLTKEKMIVKDNKNGGIVVVGSHTKKTTSQLESLKEVDGIEFIEFNSDLVLDEMKFEQEIKRVVSLSEKFISEGTTVVTYTKRKLLVVENDSKEDALIRSVKISDAVQSL